jgi:hypothetical protein
MRFSGRLAVMTAIVMGFVVLFGPAAQAAYYNGYSTVASTPDAYDCTGAQGFAAGSTYLYSIKNRTSDDGRAVIYRVNKTTGEKVVMTNTASDVKYTSWLGHANDMTIVDINGEHYMFVVTMNTTGAQLIKLHYDGTNYSKVGAYQVQLSGAVAAVSGINRVSVTSSQITFMFKSGRTIYTGTLPLTANSGTVALTKAFTLQVEGALVNGAPVAGLETWSTQGIFYDPTDKVLYYPLTQDNKSVVLVYRDVSTSTTGNITSASDLSFRITSSAYSKFEIEGVGLSGGRLYFNTNRANSDGAYDGVHVFDGYTT